MRARLDRYRVGISYHFHFTPRDIDDMELPEFDQYARQVDHIAEQEKKNARASASAGRMRR